MKSHNGMRPQDIAILLKITTLEKESWQYRDLAAQLSISVSEISESLNRSHLAGLIDESKKKVYRQNLLEFLEHGLHYVFPQQPGTMITGIPTAHSHPFFQRKFAAELQYAWPDENGTMRGLKIQPLYDKVVEAVKLDEKLYQLLACIDIIRVGRVREIKLATEVLRKHLA